MSNTPYYLSSCAPYSETAAANPMRAYSKEDCAEIIAHEGGAAYVLAEDYERALATATRERDEARAEVKRLLGVLLGHVPHTYEGNCPDSHDAKQRDPYCHACQILAATEPKP